MEDRSTSARRAAAVGASALLGILALAALATWAARPRPDRPTAGRLATRPASAAVAAVPLYTSPWIDDTGLTASYRYTHPIDDPRDPADAQAARRARVERGLEAVRAKLADLRAQGDADRSRLAELEMELGGLCMAGGLFEEATRHYQSALACTPESEPLVRANLEAQIGVAALRLGETENCVACCNEASCIFPLAESAVHARTEGSREAIRRFTSYLAVRPDDLGVRWLLNVAYMTLGEYPDHVPPQYLIPLEPFDTDPGVEAPRFVNVAAAVGLNARGPSMAGGSVFDDFDGDGLLDLVTSTEDPDAGASFFRNKGDGTFEDLSESSGLASQAGALNLKATDFDNDGHLDLLFLRGAWEYTPQRMTLMRNNGDDTFTDVTVAAGLDEPISTATAAWADYDDDGDLDLYVCGEYRPAPSYIPGVPTEPDPRNRSRLYRNNGDGTFTDVAAEAGVLNERFAKGVAWGDYDGDGRVDLFVSNMGGGPCRLYRNNGDGTFTDLAGLLGVTGPEAAFACWFWDFDDDGRLDLFVNVFDGSLDEAIKDYLGLPAHGHRPRLYRNHGAGGFLDVTAEAGLDHVFTAMGSNFGDVDNDGRLDFYEGTGTPSYAYLLPNRLFRNLDGRRFADVTAASGTGHLQKGHGVSFGDWDRDGDLDLFVRAGGATPGDKAHAVLFQNPGNGHHWLHVKLVGITSNRPAVGARIRVDLPGPDGSVVSRYRTISSGSNWGGNGFPVTIGLGDAAKVLALEVSWPTSRTVQTFRDVPIDSALEITEHDASFRVLDWSPIPVPQPADGPVASRR